MFSLVPDFPHAGGEQAEPHGPRSPAPLEVVVQYGPSNANREAALAATAAGADAEEPTVDAEEPAADAEEPAADVEEPTAVDVDIESSIAISVRCRFGRRRRKGLPP